jgi:hypothetical protein
LAPLVAQNKKAKEKKAKAAKEKKAKAKEKARKEKAKSKGKEKAQELEQEKVGNTKKANDTAAAATVSSSLVELHKCLQKALTIQLGSSEGHHGFRSKRLQVKQDQAIPKGSPAS